MPLPPDFHLRLHGMPWNPAQIAFTGWMEVRLGLARQDDEFCEVHENLRNHQDGWAVLLGMVVAFTIRILAYEGFHF